MVRNLFIGAALCALCSVSALAGEEVLYNAAPEWVEVKPGSALDTEGANPLVLMERQVRLEQGRVWDYFDLAIKFDSPEAMTQLGTITAEWLPDKGDLIVHRVELMRGGEVIDLTGGKPFEVLRRERQLESRLLDGQLTATMTVPGARQGDTLRVAYSTTLSDQALGDEVQWTGALPPKPFPLKDGRIVVSWPEGMDVDWRTFRLGDGIKPVTQNGYKRLAIELPVAKPDEMPFDAPSRFQMPPLLQVGSFDSYTELSRLMAPHYTIAGAIAPGSELAGQVKAIEAKSSDPLTRAAIALRLVQDEVSYLLNGLNGGNYLPQKPAETWEARYGDCKAKSVLLLALLREMGIEAKAVLVRSGGGDALPDMLPMAANFDHMIVQATIDGTDYWLDGTGGGTRLSNISEVPRFFYALPIVEQGTDLVQMVDRVQQAPDQIVTITIDQRAGIGIPALYDVEIQLLGSTGAQMRAVAGQDNEEVLENAVLAQLYAVVGSVQMTDYALSYDEDTGIGLVKASGVMTTPWGQERGRYELEPPAQEAKNLDFSIDRARPAWKDIPVNMNGPIYRRSNLTVLLPDQGEGYTLEGTQRIARTIGTVAVKSDAALAGDRFSLKQEMQSTAIELAAADLPDAKRSLAAHLRDLPNIKAPRDARKAWEYTGKDHKLLASLEAAYAKLVAQADDDDLSALDNRASFRAGTLDFAGALEDYDAIAAIEPDIGIYLKRAHVRAETGDLDGALADLHQVEMLSGDGSTYYAQIELLGVLGRGEEAVVLAEDYADLAEEAHNAARLRAVALGWNGQAEEGIALVEGELVRRPGDGSLLNELCWERSIWDMVEESTLDICTKAVEKSDYSPPILDSRALAFYRLGRFEEALESYNAALADDPAMPETRYMRGITKMKLGQTEAGRAEVELALRMSPQLRQQYARWGIEPDM